MESARGAGHGTRPGAGSHPWLVPQGCRCSYAVPFAFAIEEPNLTKFGGDSHPGKSWRGACSTRPAGPLPADIFSTSVQFGAPARPACRTLALACIGDLARTPDRESTRNACRWSLAAKDRKKPGHPAPHGSRLDLGASASQPFARPRRLSCLRALSSSFQRVPPGLRLPSRSISRRRLHLCTCPKRLSA